MRLFRRILPVVTLLAAAAPRALSAGTVSPELEEMLQQSPPNARVPVIISLAEQTDPRETADTLEAKADRLVRIVGALKTKALATQNRPGCGQLGLLDELDAAGPAAATGVRRLWAVNAVAVEATPPVIESVSLRGDVGEVAYAGTQLAGSANPPGNLPPGWNLTHVRAPQAWAAGYRGAGALVALIGTGAAITHPDLAANVQWDGPNWHDAVEGLVGAYDTDGHGTHLLGIAVGQNGIGVAPGAKWMACRAFVRNGSTLETTLARFIECAHFVLDPDHIDIDDATSPDPAHVPDVVLSHLIQSPAGICNQSIAHIIRIWRAARILPVFSVGDALGTAPPDGVPSPANDPAVLSVGGGDGNGTILPETYRGVAACGIPMRSAPQLIAPGVRVESAWRTGRAIRGGSDVAAAHVAGAAAIVRGARPDTRRVSVDLLDEGLVRSGVPVAGGHRRLDVLAAVTLEDAEFEAHEPPPPSVLTGATIPVSVTMRNTGLTTWARGVHRLRFSNPNQPWGFDFVDLPASIDEVLPGERVHFSFEVTPSSVDAGEIFQWRMYRTGAGYFGEASAPVQIAVYGYDGAAFIRQTVGCAGPGAPGTASITFRNTGTNIWTRAGGYALGKLGTYGDPALVELSSTEAVHPQGEKTFTMFFPGPSPAGRYAFQRQMKHGGSWMGEGGASRIIDTNTCSSDDAGRMAPYGVPELRVGHAGTLTLTVGNTGQSTWHSAYCLRGGEGTFWGTAASASCLGSGQTVTPAGQRQFSMPLVAPNQPGRWPYSYRMQNALGIPFGTTFSGTTGIPRDHQASVEWSSSQGAHNWFYRYYSPSDGGWRRMAWMGNTHWHGGQASQDVWPQAIHPGTTNPAGRFWKSPVDGYVRVSGQVYDLDPACGDGVVFRIRRNKDLLAQATLENGGAPIAFSQEMRVYRDDTIRFIVRPRSNNHCDLTFLDPLVQVLPPLAPATGPAPAENYLVANVLVEPAGD